MGYRGIVRGDVVVLKNKNVFPDGTEVEVSPAPALPPGTPAALLEVWGSELPGDVWGVLEQAVLDLDRADRERERRQPRG